MQVAEQSGSVQEIESGDRFEFGENWKRFLQVLDEGRIDLARSSLVKNLGTSDHQGKTFLDIGSGSGLFSLVAAQLGAKVVSFDYDPQSVACTKELKRRYAPENEDWEIHQGSALDPAFLEGLGQFDIVYSWGVLHHTGELWRAVELAAQRVKPEGLFYIALYNDQGWRSRYWLRVKRAYNKQPAMRGLLVAIHAPTQFGLRWAKRAVTGKLGLERGMSLWHDMIDWLGGYPFEVATPRQVHAFCQKHGFSLVHEKTVGGRQGCNEFVFTKSRQPA